MKQGDVVWCSLPEPDGRRPVVILTRTPALQFLSGVTVAPLTTSLRSARSFVSLSLSDGLSADSAVNCDRLMTVPATSLGEQITSLGKERLREVRAAIEFALGLPRLGED
ncbi:MAG: type II toxin-antitoxin system PemK/MazF family toxin [Tepidiformaceae bacterium]